MAAPLPPPQGKSRLFLSWQHKINALTITLPHPPLPAVTHAYSKLPNIMTAQINTGTTTGFFTFLFQL